MSYRLSPQALGPNDLVLTPNRRLAAWLARDYNQYQSEKGLLAWENLAAHPLDQWLMARIQAAPRLRLSDTQCLRLWQSILEADDLAGVDSDGLAQLSHQARSLIFRWQLKPGDWNTNETPENELFCRSHQRYQATLEKNQWLDSNALLTSVVNQPLPDDLCNKRIFLHGFNDENEPLLQSVKQWLTQHGNEVQFSHGQTKAGQQQVINFDQVAEQFPKAILWALEQLQQQPGARVAVVVPSLQTLRRQLALICEDIFAGNEQLTGPWQSWINITAGQPLSQYPIVAHLLLLLKLLDQTGSLSEWRVLLSSPFFADGNTEFVARDAFYHYLLKRNIKQSSSTKLVKLWKSFCEKNGESSTTLFDLLSDTSFVRGRRSSSEWVTTLKEIITTSRWAKDRTLSSEEYQVVASFNDALYSVNELHLVSGAHNFTRFVKDINWVLTNNIFQPQTETAPIQVMGILEAAGLSFDALWLCECESVNWPQAPNPNPLLPKSTLKRFGMPGSGAERELNYANRILSGFSSNADRVIFSWGRFQQDTQQTLSPLLEHVTASSEPGFAYAFVPAEIGQQNKLHSLISKQQPDEQGLALDQSNASGGSSLIQAQSLCPFKAYGQYRLQLREEASLYEGVNPMDRGKLIHSALENFWRQVQSHANLKSLLDQANRLTDVIKQVVAETIEEYKQNTQWFPQALYELEQARVTAILERWITECEINRSPFTINQVEKHQTLSINGLSLDLQVDRIDTLEDGSQIIIDYKTPKKNITSTLGERPEEPQLPLYVLLNPDQTQGIFFGILRPEKVSWAGLVNDSVSFIPKKPRTILHPESGWGQQLEDWRTCLNQLAGDFKSGIASVTPLNQQVCDHCHLAAVCRVKELSNDLD